MQNMYGIAQKCWRNDDNNKSEIKSKVDAFNAENVSLKAKLEEYARESQRATLAYKKQEEELMNLKASMDISGATRSKRSTTEILTLQGKISAMQKHNEKLLNIRTAQLASISKYNKETDEQKAKIQELNSRLENIQIAPNTSREKLQTIIKQQEKELQRLITVQAAATNHL